MMSPHPETTNATKFTQALVFAVLKNRACERKGHCRTAQVINSAFPLFYFSLNCCIVVVPIYAIRSPSGPYLILGAPICTAHAD